MKNGSCRTQVPAVSADTTEDTLRTRGASAALRSRFDHVQTGNRTPPASTLPIATAARQLDPVTLADLRRHSRWNLLRVIWPFLLAIPMLLALIAASFYLLAAGRAYTEGESLWSKGQKDAVQFLARYHDSCDEADFELYREAIAVPLGDRRARLAMLQPSPDMTEVREGLLQGGNHPDEIGGMVFLFMHLRELPLLRDVVQIWADADVALLALTEAAERMHASHRALCAQQRHDRSAMQEVYRINDALTPLQREFSQRLGHVNRTIQAGLIGLMLVAAVLLTVAGVALSRRVVLRAGVAEAMVRQELRRRRQSLRELRELLATLTDTTPRRDPGDSVPDAPDDMTAVTGAVSLLAAQEHATNARLQAILSLSPDAFVSIDGHSVVSDISPAFEAMTGLDPAGLLGSPEAEVYARLDALLQSGQRLTGPDQLRRRDTPLQLMLAGPGHRVLTAELREAEDSGDILRVRRVLCLRDVSREHEIDRLKSEFLSLAAHELRTPMASIFGFVELLLNRRYDEIRQRGMLDIVHRKSRLMIGIIDDLLDLSRLEARQELALQIESLDMAALLARIVDEFPLPEGRDKPRLTLPDEPAPVQADAAKLTRVITNLLTNAYKFSPDGGAVEVALHLEGARAGIEIRDSGIGMTPGQLARLGERFYRADASGNIPGTGLGVSIVREILELHGGALEVRSQPGEGSVFTAWLPRQNLPDLPDLPPATT